MKIFKALGWGGTVAAMVIVAALVVEMVLAGTARDFVIFISGMALATAQT